MKQKNNNSATWHVAFLFYFLLANCNASFACQVKVEELSNYNEQELTDWLDTDASALDFLIKYGEYLPFDTQEFIRYKLIEKNYANLIKFLKITIAYSPDGNYALCASGSGLVKLYNLSECTYKVLEGHSGRIILAAFSPDGKYILAASDKEKLGFWDLTTVSTTYNEIWGEDLVTSISFSQGDKAKAIVGYRYGWVHIWEMDLCKAAALLGGYNLHKREVTAVALWDSCALSGAKDRKVYQFISNQTLPNGHSLLTKQNHRIEGIEFTRDGKYGVIGVCGNVVQVWQFDNAFQDVDCLFSFDSFIKRIATNIFYANQFSCTESLWELREILSIASKFSLQKENATSKELIARIRFKFQGHCEIDENRKPEIDENGCMRVNLAFDYENGNVAIFDDEFFFGNTTLGYVIKFTPEGEYVITGSYQEAASLGYQCFSNFTLAQIAFAVELIQSQSSAEKEQIL